MERGRVVADRFEITAEAGTGGMARVYQARDRHTGEEVALKVLVSERDAERFLREARLLAELDDPSIVRYVAHGRTPAGELYLAMEWLEGEDLATRLRRGPLAVDETATIGGRVARALAVAHARGVVHRDVKPTNIFLPGGAPEHAKVLDFGIARWTSSAWTRTGAILGTPGYMSPEQARGRQEADARSDLFSLGCVLYECLTGRAAFAGAEPLAVLGKILFEEIPPVSDSCPDVPLAFEALIAQMLSKDAAARPADAASVAAALAGLEPALASSPRPARPRVSSLGAEEQRFLAVLLTRPAPPSVDETAQTWRTDGTSPLEMIRTSVEQVGGEADLLVDGSIVVVLSGGRSTAIDRAAQAARCALAIRQLFPSATTVLAMGRGTLAASHPVGEGLERAARLLRETPSGAEIRVDPATAAMLEGRFSIRHGQAIELVDEHEALETERTFLGSPTPCVGRDRELAILAGWFEECISEPRSRAVVVTAPAGIGKTRLAREFVRGLRERRGFTEVWIAGGDPTRAGSAFGILAPLVRRVAGIRGGEPIRERQRRLAQRLSRRLAGEGLEHATVFLAELVGAPFSEEGRPVLAAARRDVKTLGQHMRRAFCAWLSAECEAAPVSIVLEDLHWGDLPTVQFIGFALRELAERPLFVLALARPEVDELFPRLWAAEGALELRLGGLSKRACESLVRHCLRANADTAIVERIVRQAAGNAFFLEELIRAAAERKADTLPETVLAMATTRLERLPPEARRIMRAASVFGEVFWERGVAALVGAQDLPNVGKGLEELAIREFVTRRPDAHFAGEVEYAFRHGLVREAAYAMLTDSDRALGHRLAGEWLASAGESQACVLAEHFERGGDTSSARGWYTRAAAQALEANDFHAVHRYAARAIELGVEGDALRQAHELRGVAFMALGAWLEAPRELRAALALVPDDRREHQAELRLRLARACFFAFDVTGLRDHASSALTLLQGLDRCELEAEATAALGIYEQAAGNLEAAADAYARARTRAGGRYFASEAQLLLTLLWKGDVEASIERGRAFVEQARSMNDVYALMVALPQVALGLVAKGRYQEAQRVFDEARETGQRLDAGPLVARAIAMSVGYRQDAFDFAGAEAVAQEALAMALSRNYPATVVSTSIDLLLNAARVGDIARAQASLAPTADRVATTEGQGWHGWLFKMRFTAACAQLALAMGDAEAAVLDADQVIALSHSFGRVKYQVIGHVTRGQALIAMDRRQEGVTALRSGLDGARRLDDPALVLRAAVPLLDADGDNELLAAARRAADQMRAALPDSVRAAFVAAEAVRRLDLAG